MRSCTDVSCLRYQFLADDLHQSDFPEAVKGQIALVQRGTCQLGLKVAFAGAAGAVGTIIYNNIDAEPISGTLGAPSRPQGPYVPVAYISGLNGKAFIASISEGTEVVANIRVQSFVEDRETSNVIATTKTGDRNNLIVAGAHSDSVPAGPVSGSSAWLQSIRYDT